MSSGGLDAADAAAYAADAAAYAADATAKKQNQKATADICRQVLTEAVFKIIHKHYDTKNKKYNRNA